MVAKSKTEVREPGANSKVGSVPFVLTRYRFFFVAYFRYPQQLENWPGKFLSIQEAIKKF